MNTERKLIGYRIVRTWHGWREWVFHTQASEDFGPSQPDWTHVVTWSTMYEATPKDMRAAKKLAKKMGGRLVPVYLRVVSLKRCMSDWRLIDRLPSVARMDGDLQALPEAERKETILAALRWSRYQFTSYFAEKFKVPEQEWPPSPHDTSRS